MRRLAFAVLVLFACNERGPDAGSADAAGDAGLDGVDAPVIGGLPSGIAVDRVCRPWADVVCERAGTCACANRTALSEGEALTQCLRTTIETCLMALGGDRVERRLADGDLVVSDARVEGALRALRAIAPSCGPDVPAASLLESLHVPNVGLDQTVATTVPLGSDCDAESAGSEYCARGDGRCTDGSCVALVTEGAACPMLGPNMCASGTFCDGDPDWEWPNAPEGVCTPLGSLEQGRPCLSNEACVLGLKCLAGLCTPPPTVGESCPDAQCAPGLACQGEEFEDWHCRSGHSDLCYVGTSSVPDNAPACSGDWTCWSDTPLRCAPSVQEGAPCSPGDVCDPGLRCRADDDGTRQCLPYCVEDADCPGDGICVWNRCTNTPIPSGGACDPFEASHWRCADGLVCSFGDGAGTCEEPPAIGEPCGPTSPQCASDAVCRSGTCVAIPGEGELCDDVEPRICAAGLECRREAGAVCTPLPEEGEACASTCAEGLLCTRPSLDAPATCSSTLPAEGEPCGPRGACAAGLTCRAPGPDSICMPGLPGDGDPCFPGQECADGAQCIQHGARATCFATAALGEPCVPGVQPCEDGALCMCEGPTCACSGDSCEQTVCRPFVATGEPCAYDAQCGPTRFCIGPSDDRPTPGICGPRRTRDEACIGDRARQCQEGLFCQGPGYAGTCIPELCRLYGP